MSVKIIAHFSPGRIIFCALLATIIIGTALLSLSIARTQPVGLLDLFFTATSVTCVTGLFTVPLTSFTTFGHTVILVLTQIGGLGVISLTIFLLSLFVNFGFASKLMAVKLLELESWHNIKRLILFIIGLTIAFELLGALCIFFAIKADYPTHEALFLSVFHAVTSFCNAGFTLFDGGMIYYNSNYLMLLSSIALMFAGGLGFLTWHELFQYAFAKRHKKRHSMTLNTKIVLYSSLILITVSTLLFFILEHNHAFETMTTPLALVNALLQAVSSRSAGLLSVNLHTLHLATLFFTMMCAFIGAAPASTGSGVKLTTFAVFIATVKASITGRTSVEIKGRSIGTDQVYKAIAIVSLSIAWIMSTTFFLLITDPTLRFVDIFFESVSAFATLGLSTGITSTLSAAGKILIISNMMIGRLGSLTLILALKNLRHRKIDTTEFSYPEERVLLS